MDDISPAASAPDVFAAIAHPARRRILDLLARDERPVNDLASHFAMSRPAVSQHLRALRDAGLVAETRHGRERRYRLAATAPTRLGEASAWLARYERFWAGGLRSLGAYLDREADAAGAGSDRLDADEEPTT
ncbi:MAG: winged helix-turn-helix transcriptional regulator [Chloroflexota bacterium]|nr:winged helix-turn-helix transcriptional regulator [Chloroflexota bacterium]